MQVQNINYSQNRSKNQNLAFGILKLPEVIHSSYPAEVINEMERLAEGFDVQVAIGGSNASQMVSSCVARPNGSNSPQGFSTIFSKSCGVPGVSTITRVDHVDIRKDEHPIVSLVKAAVDNLKEKLKA